VQQAPNIFLIGPHCGWRTSRVTHYARILVPATWRPDGGSFFSRKNGTPHLTFP
jgi:hypothetical protein